MTERRRRLAGRAAGPRATAVAALLTGAGIAAGAGGCVGDRGPDDRDARTVTVAVAANFADAHDDLAAAFTAATGVRVLASVGSTGQLYAQIRNGAPFDVLLAADTLRPARLVADGAAAPASRFTYAAGRLALYAPAPGRPPVGEATLTGRPAARIAIANPKTAPYGAAAVRVLERMGLLDRVADRLVRGENVAQAYAFVRSGAAEAGLVAFSQVVDAPPDAYWLVPDSLHPPIRQDAVLLARAADDPAARRYLEFLRGGEARRLIESSGYGMEP